MNVQELVNGWMNEMKQLNFILCNNSRRVRLFINH